MPGHKKLLSKGKGALKKLAKKGKQVAEREGKKIVKKKMEQKGKDSLAKAREKIRQSRNKPNLDGASDMLKRMNMNQGPRTFSDDQVKRMEKARKSRMGDKPSAERTRRNMDKIKNSGLFGSMAKGGRVKKTGPYKLHKGETVLTAAQSKSLKKVLNAK